MDESQVLESLDTDQLTDILAADRQLLSDGEQPYFYREVKEDRIQEIENILAKRIAA